MIGDVSKGSENDKLLSEIIGDNWKELVKVDSPVINNYGRGYDHTAYWPKIMKKLQVLKQQNLSIDHNMKSIDIAVSTLTTATVDTTNATATTNDDSVENVNSYTDEKLSSIVTGIHDINIKKNKDNNDYDI